jgi:hypothetical protein
LSKGGFAAVRITFSNLLARGITTQFPLKESVVEKEKQELIQKVGALVEEQFAGDFKSAFDHYANKRSQTGSIDSDELSELLRDADIGNTFTRGFWVSGIMAEVDKDNDGFITYTELEKIVQSG